jgi:hypothetical protein
MSGILLPEIIIYNTLESIVKLLKKDLTDHPNSDKETILYKILGIDEEGQKIKMNLYEYFKQAKKMISKPDNLSVNFGYNQKVTQSISMHILLPSEQGKSSIGEDEGYIEDDIIEGEGENAKKVGTQQYFTQTYDCTYQIMITSSNSSEVNIVYNVLKSMLLMLVPHLESMGLRIPTLSGNDIVMQDDIIPVPIFHKVINLSFTYEHNVPQLLKNEIAKKFFFTMNMIDYNYDDSQNQV